MITRVLAVTDDAAPFTSNRTLTGTLSQLFPAGRRGRREVCRIPIPETPANCCFGGDDFRTVFVTARTSLYAVDVGIEGLRR